MVLLRTLFLILPLFIIEANAQWFDAKGRAPITNNNIDIARNMAVQDALKHALLFTGAQVSSITQLTNGLLSSDQFEVRSSGNVRGLRLISEDTANDIMTVHIRADIISTEPRCHASALTQLIAMTNFPINNRQQAANGGIFDIGAHIAAKLFSKMSMHQGNIKATELFPITQSFHNSNQPFTNNDSQQSPQQLLAKQADSQYLLTASIKDMSVAKPTSQWLGLIKNSPMREFVISFTLFDALNGEKAWHKQYMTRASWTFEKTEKVDTSSQQFWQSHYGASIDHQLSSLIGDLDEHLQCMQVKGQVIETNNEYLTVNLGKRNGVKAGDKLNIYHLSTFTDGRGIVRQSTVINPATYVVQDLYQNHLKATPENGILYGDVQNDALVVVAPPPKSEF